jgi:hypothetical protein
MEDQCRSDRIDDRKQGGKGKKEGANDAFDGKWAHFKVSARLGIVGQVKARYPSANAKFL